VEQPREYAAWCNGIGIKPVLNPFWKFLLYANIYQSITPDILHQLHQGMTKHLILWLQSAFGTTELDQQSRCLPLNHNVRHFSKGISGFLWISGKEHAEMCKILLGLIIVISADFSFLFQPFTDQLSTLSSFYFPLSSHKALTLGTNPPVPSQYMLSTWWFHVQNTNTFLNQNMLSSFRIH
jgi:hypothetical protein